MNDSTRETGRAEAQAQKPAMGGVGRACRRLSLLAWALVAAAGGRAAGAFRLGSGGGLAG